MSGTLRTEHPVVVFGSLCESCLLQKITLRKTMFSTPIDTAVHKGGCHCGSVSYAVTGKPTLSAYCHCTNCQKLNGVCHPAPQGLATDDPFKLVHSYTQSISQHPHSNGPILSPTKRLLTRTLCVINLGKRGGDARCAAVLFHRIIPRRTNGVFGVDN